MIKHCRICTGTFDTKIRSSRARTCSDACGKKLNYITHRKARETWERRHPGRKKQLGEEYRKRNIERVRKLARENATKRRRAKGIKPRPYCNPPKKKRYQFTHCVVCDQEINRSQRKHARKTCSLVCSETLYQKVLAKGRDERAKRRICICAGCGRAFRPRRRLGAKYCSKKCKHDVRRADPVRKEKTRLRSWRQLRKRGASIRPPVMTPEERKEKRKKRRIEKARASGVKPQKRLTAEERLQRKQQKVARHKIKQKEMYANDPVFRAKRRAASRDYRLRMIQADPTWAARNNAAHRERELKRIANPQGEKQWLERSRVELQRVKRLLSGEPLQKVLASPRKGSTPHSSSPP